MADGRCRLKRWIEEKGRKRHPLCPSLRSRSRGPVRSRNFHFEARRVGLGLAWTWTRSFLSLLSFPHHHHTQHLSFLHYALRARIPSSQAFTGEQRMIIFAYTVRPAQLPLHLLRPLAAAPTLNASSSRGASPSTPWAHRSCKSVRPRNPRPSLHPALGSQARHTEQLEAATKRDPGPDLDARLHASPSPHLQSYR